MKQFSKHLLLSFFFTISLSTIAEARVVSCGDTVLPGQKAILAEPLNCNDATGGITVIGPGSLDMKRNPIYCDPDSSIVGVTVAGEKAKVKNGFVYHCWTAIKVTGSGKHRIDGMQVGFNGLGFEILSDNNRLKGNLAGNSKGWGFELYQADRNSLSKNISVDNTYGGFKLQESKRNKLLRNTATGNVGEGILIYSRATDNRLMRNVAANNGLGDLVDWTPDCANRWQRNLYGSVDARSGEDCIE